MLDFTVARWEHWDVRTDPSDTGGMFIGRRPGGGPTHFRKPPRRGSATRQRADGFLSEILFAAITVISLLCWGPIPLAGVWIGSQADYLSGSIFLGIVVAFVALFPLLFGALAILSRLDHAWILVRRAAGRDQRRGVLGRIFATTTLVCALPLLFWLVVIQGPVRGGAL
jgi:hypothetical protein